MENGVRKIIGLKGVKGVTSNLWTAPGEPDMAKIMGANPVHACFTLASLICLHSR